MSYNIISILFLYCDITDGDNIMNNFQTVLPPSSPLLLDSCNIIIPNYCDGLTEKHYFDVNCYSDNNSDGNLGCNAGGFKCCRYCEFGQYLNISCVESPSPPPSPLSPPDTPPSPPILPNPPNIPPPSSPPYSPKPCRTIIPNYCDELIENHYFDIDCYSYNDIYGNLGCNAGGLKCCRFCEFGHYQNISCIESPSPPPSPVYPPPPKNPLVISIDDIVTLPEKAKIKFNIRIQSTVETFDRTKFKKNLRLVFDNSVSPENIILLIRAGSLIVDVTILTNISYVNDTSDIISNMTPIILSDVLNESVIELSSPIVIKYNYSNFIDSENQESMTYIPTLIGIVIFFIILLIWRKNKKLKEIKKNKNQDNFENRLDGVSCLNTYKDSHKLSNINVDMDTDFIGDSDKSFTNNLYA